MNSSDKTLPLLEQPPTVSPQNPYPFGCQRLCLNHDVTETHCLRQLHQNAHDERCQDEHCNRHYPGRGFLEIREQV